MFNHIMIAYKRIITNPLRFLELKNMSMTFQGKHFFPHGFPFKETYDRSGRKGEGHPARSR